MLHSLSGTLGVRSGVMWRCLVARLFSASLPSLLASAPVLSPGRQRAGVSSHCSEAVPEGREHLVPGIVLRLT